MSKLTSGFTTVITVVSALMLSLPAQAHFGAVFHNLIDAAAVTSLFVFVLLLRHRKLIRRNQ